MRHSSPWPTNRGDQRPSHVRRSLAARGTTRATSATAIGGCLGGFCIYTAASVTYARRRWLQGHAARELRKWSTQSCMRDTRAVALDVFARLVPWAHRWQVFVYKSKISSTDFRRLQIWLGSQTLRGCVAARLMAPCLRSCEGYKNSHTQFAPKIKFKLSL